jgi:hypothetical protein
MNRTTRVRQSGFPFCRCNRQCARTHQVVTRGIYTHGVAGCRLDSVAICQFLGSPLAAHRPRARRRAP